jgi:hypothetical protein
METFPDNHRAKWTDCEINNLLSEVKKRTPFHIIAENHHRTIGAIKFKLIRYAIEELKDNELSLSMDYLTRITNLSKEELLEGFKKLNFNYEEEDVKVHSNDNYQVVINKLDIIDSNLKQIWACIFTGILIQFMIHFKTFTNH